jgi:NAD(P)-dependent dehydrogenase (short-subunit alcohol dehydrogenase family)
MEENFAEGKHVVITGATRGIGLATAHALAARGATLSIIGRDPEKGKQAIAGISRECGDSRARFYRADLSVQKEIRSVAAMLLQERPQVDVVINNAAVWYSRFGLTEDQIERMFAVNHLAGFLLTHLLIGGLKRAGRARVINMASDSHFNGKIHFDNLNLAGHYHGLRAYRQSKLANVLFTYEFARRNPGMGIAIHAVHPGLVKTDIGIRHTDPFHRLAWRLRRSAGSRPEEGAATAVFLASASEGDSMTPRYWSECLPRLSSARSHHADDAARLWDASERLCGIRDYF